MFVGYCFCKTSKDQKDPILNVRDGESSDHIARYTNWKLVLSFYSSSVRLIVYTAVVRLLIVISIPKMFFLSTLNTLHVKISDFGLAKIQSGQTPFKSQCDTLDYAKDLVGKLLTVDPNHEWIKINSLKIVLNVDLCI
ncbi:hypothetical protein BDC45DRAFT_536667 [Circinella umbellata]|nr:hypothetical protein BDC45DRAFT_536667 [Circinella umbellata]